MVTCPWCGTCYERFQSNCDNCGGSLPLPTDEPSIYAEPASRPEIPFAPPLPPRQVPHKIIGRMLITDAGAITGGILLFLRYENAYQTIEVLRNGQAALCEITDVAQNYHVRVNNRYPWMIQYQFKVHGQSYMGKLSTLSQPDLSQHPGKPVYVLYQQDDPKRNTLYPSPYGYFGI